MWILEQPDYNKAYHNDIDLMVSLGIIDNNEAQQLRKIVEQYHNAGGTITKQQQDQLPEDAQNRIHKGYTKKKYMYEGNQMYHVTQEIYHNVGTCPFCGNGAAETLEHFMHKSYWKSLSLCRLNLIPMCWKCNNKKSIDDHLNFLHPYYAAIPRGVIFMNAQCTLKGNGYTFTFDFDNSVVTDPDIYNRVVYQWNKLKLNERLQAAVTQFICSSVINDIKDEDQLRIIIPIIINKIKNEYGLNHWRSAILRACQDELNGPNHSLFYQAITYPSNKNRDVKV